MERYAWNWGVLATQPYVQWLLSGLMWTFLLALAGWVIALVLGSVLGIARTVENRAVRALAAAYVEFFRNVPLLVQIFLWYFVLPELLPAEAGRWLKRGLPYAEFWTAVVSLGTYTAARVGESLRAGIESVGKGQTNAALATGLTMPQVYVYVLVPVGYRITVPALTGELINIFKNSALALTIGVLEITSRTRQIAEFTYNIIELFTAATVIYALISLAVTYSMRFIEIRARLPGMVAARHSGA